MWPHALPRLPRGLMLLSLLTFWTLGVAGCATAPKAPQITVPASLRAECDRPNPQGVQTVGQLAGYSVRQDAAIGVCDAKRAALVEIIDGANVAVKPKKRWPF